MLVPLALLGFLASLLDGAQPVNGNEYVVWISQNGPAVRGASVTFQADLYSSDGSRPEGKFRFNWMDNTLPSPHDFTDETNNPRSIWKVSYSAHNYPGPYEVQVNVDKDILIIWQPICSRRTTFNVTECGVVPSTDHTIVPDHTKVDLPWHVGIYKNSTSKDGGLTQICSGALVLPNLVISAAHCFHRPSPSKSVPQQPGHFKVAVHKRLRDWNTAADGALKRDVSKIEIPSQFTGRNNSHASDIALLVLSEPVEGVTPVCVDWDGVLQPLKQGDTGRVAGWGRARGKPSEELLNKELAFVPKEQCKEIATRSVLPLLLPLLEVDKFCAIVTNGVATGPGDGGSPMIFQQEGKWYARGVTSVGTRGEPRLDFLTKMEEHRDWMARVRKELDS